MPAAPAPLADRGAEGIEIERVSRGDTLRGLAASGMAIVPNNVPVLRGTRTRGRQRLGLDLASPDGREIPGRYPRGTGVRPR